MNSQILNNMLYINKLSTNATIPTLGSKYAAGYDLYSAYDYKVLAKSKCLIKTDIAVEIPKGYYGRIAPRSGLSWKKFTDIGAGVIDNDYRGPLGVVLFNHNSEILNIEKGDRVAQLIITPYITPDIIVKELSTSNRGSGGFGSTGK